MLAERKNIDIKVFYTWSQTEADEKYDPGFGQNITWDIALLEGYSYNFVNNVSHSPGSHHFKGIDNPMLISAITNWGADAVLIYGWAFKSHLKAMRFFHTKIPVFFRGDSTLLDEKIGLKKKLRRLYLQYIYRNIDKAFYAGAANKAYFIAMGFREEQLVFMPHAIDNARFAANSVNNSAGEQLRQMFNIHENETVFLFAGKLQKKKQPDVLIACFNALKLLNSYLIIVGSGEMETALKDANPGNPHILFLGFKNQEQMPGVYNACDVFILPSKGPNETWGLAINEAMAAGKAIIASDKCGAAYNLIKDDINGFVFNWDDSSALKEALKYFENNKNATVKMGMESAIIIKEYSFLHACEEIENIFKKAVSNNEK